jgi:hypothetical protein
MRCERALVEQWSLGLFVLSALALPACGGSQASFGGGDGGPGDSSVRGDSSPTADSSGDDSAVGSDASAREVGASDAGGGDDAAIDSPTADVSTGDAASDGVADAGFQVGSLPMLVLWLEGAKGLTQSNGNKVASWADQSGHGNDASSMTGSEPIYVASDIGGLPGVHFQGGSHLSIADSASLQLGTNDFLIEVVVAWTNVGANYGFIFGKAAYAVAPYYGAILFANYPVLPFTSLAVQTSNMDYVLSAASNLNTGTPLLAGFQRSGTTLAARINGTVVGTRSVNPVDDCSAVGNPAFIGAQAAGGQALAGDVAEIVELSGGISASDVQGLEGHLMAKYGL